MGLPMYVPPEQLIKDRADFARKGIARGRPIVALEYQDGVLLIGENSSASLRKIGEIYDRVAFAGVGRFNEFETLRVAGVRYADLKGYAYARADVTAKGLANAYSQTVGQIFTHEVKPYEVDVMVAEINGTGGASQIYRIQFDGTLHDETGFGAIGGNEDDLRQHLEGAYEPDMDFRRSLRLGTEAIATIEDREIDDDAWEAAVLDRNLGRRKFRRVSAAEITAARS